MEINIYHDLNNKFNLAFFFFFTLSTIVGIVGPFEGHSHSNNWGLHIYKWSEVPSTSQTKHGTDKWVVRVDALHKVGTGAWSRHLRLSDINHTSEISSVLFECRWWVYITTYCIRAYVFIQELSGMRAMFQNVAVPTATILGGPELYVGAGSTINLTCAIRFSSEPPAYIFWYYDGNVLSYDSPRGGVSVITEKGTDVTTSWLLIQTAQPSDSGEYSCKPSNANTASIRVHVVNGKYIFVFTLLYGTKQYVSVTLL